MKFAAIYWRELGGFFRSPLAYVLTTVFLVLSGYYFYGNLYRFIILGGFDLARGLWQYQFDDTRYLLLLMTPLLTMRSFAQERRLGTLELLWTYPVRDVSIVLGKFCAALTLLLLMLAATALQPLALAWVYPVDVGPVLTGYLGLALLGAAFVACGVFVSSLTESQMVAGTVTFGLLLLLWALGWNEAAASESVSAFLRKIALFERFEHFSRGGIDTGDVVFFVSFTVFFLFATVLSLESRTWRGVR